jgi:hypothetical protein
MKWLAEPKLDRAKVGGVDGYRPHMSLLAGQVHYLSATTPLKFSIFDFRFTSWQAASVLPRISGVLETLPRADAQPFQAGLVNRKS